MVSPIVEVPVFVEILHLIYIYILIFSFSVVTTSLKDKLLHLHFLCTLSKLHNFCYCLLTIKQSYEAQYQHKLLKTDFLSEKQILILIITKEKIRTCSMWFWWSGICQLELFPSVMVGMSRQIKSSCYKYKYKKTCCEFLYIDQTSVLLVITTESVNWISYLVGIGSVVMEHVIVCHVISMPWRKSYNPLLKKKSIPAPLPLHFLCLWQIGDMEIISFPSFKYFSSQQKERDERAKELINH